MPSLYFYLRSDVTSITYLTSFNIFKIPINVQNPSQNINLRVPKSFHIQNITSLNASACPNVAVFHQEYKVPNPLSFFPSLISNKTSIR